MLLTVLKLSNVTHAEKVTRDLSVSGFAAVEAVRSVTAGVVTNMSWKDAQPPTIGSAPAVTALALTAV